MTSAQLQLPLSVRVSASVSVPSSASLTLEELHWFGPGPPTPSLTSHSYPLHVNVRTSSPLTVGPRVSAWASAVAGVDLSNESTASVRIQTEFIITVRLRRQAQAGAVPQVLQRTHSTGTGR